MNAKIIFMILIVILVVYLFVHIFTSSPEDSDGTEMEADIETVLSDTEMPEETKVKKEYKNFYSNPAFLWPKITIGGTFTAVITFVALIFGVASYFIGHNAGGKLAKGKIFASVGAATSIGILGRSLIILIEVKIFELLKYIFPTDELILGTISEVIVYIIWITFLSGISVYFYETFTVTAEEAHPTRQ